MKTSCPNFITDPIIINCKKHDILIFPGEWNIPNTFGPSEYPPDYIQMAIYY